MPLVLALGCSCAPEVTSADDEAADRAENADEIAAELLSPANGARLTVQPWVPLAAHLPERALDAPVEVTLDGEPWSDPLALYHRRSSAAGSGVDYLATLPLTDLEPGEHTVILVFHPATGEPIHLEGRFLYARPACKLTIRVVDGEGRPSAARVAVDGPEGPLAMMGPSAFSVDPMGRDPHFHSMFVLNGQGVLYLDPGHYRFDAVRSLREDVGSAELDLVGDTELMLRVPEVVPTPGWLSADLHVHTAKSGDAFVPHWGRFASLIAAGLDVVVISDHERIIDPTVPLSTLLAGVDGTRGLAGIELRTAAKRTKDGHMNAFPLVPGPAWQGERSVAALIDAYREISRTVPVPGAESRLLLQLNHPRGIQFKVGEDPLPSAHGEFTLGGFDRAVLPGVGANAWMLRPQPGTGTTAMDIDALEVMNRFSWTLYQEVRADWFALLNGGYVFTATGNSDSHALAVEEAGLPVNLVRMPRPVPGEALNPSAFVDAIAEGHVGVSNGPVVELQVVAADADSAVAEPGDLLVARTALVHARVRAAPWVPVPEVRLVVDGMVLRKEAITAPPAGQIVDARFDWTLAMKADGWVLVEAGWPLEDKKPALAGFPLYAKLAPGHVPTGFTNPVRLDVDGDGRWVPWARRAAKE